MNFSKPPPEEDKHHELGRAKQETVSLPALLAGKAQHLEGIDGQNSIFSKETLLQLVLDNIPQLIFWKDRHSVFQGCNRRWAEAVGLNDPDLVIGKTDYEVYQQTDSNFRPTESEIEGYLERDRRVIETGEPEYQLEYKPAKEVWYETEKIAIRDEQGEIVGVLALIEDITERKLFQEKLQHQASHDPLTGLPNRALFSEHLTNALARASRHQHLGALMFLDLDRFKRINDTFGHLTGDLLLQSVAQRLKDCLRKEDIVARWGGDEFTILLSQIHCPQEAAEVAQRILVAFQPTFVIEGHELEVSSSIGITLYPQDGIDSKTLLKNADFALFGAKEQGRDRYQFYLPSF